MSYDIFLYDQRAWEHRATCDGGWDAEEKVWRDHECVGHIVEVGNMTYNIAPMWADALSVDEALTVGGGISRIMGFDGDRTPYGIHRFEGAPCVEAAVPLAAAVERMRADPARYCAMNPKNGWGNYEGALAYLERMQRLCETYPEYRIHVG